MWKVMAGVGATGLLVAYGVSHNFWDDLAVSGMFLLAFTAGSMSCNDWWRRFLYANGAHHLYFKAVSNELR